MKVVNCPACGAPASKEMLRAGECGYCHAALVDPKARPAPPAPPPPSAPTVNIVVKTPNLEEVTEAAGGIGARLVGCFSGLISGLFSLAFMVLIFAYVAWQIWISTPHPPPTPATPTVAPAPVVQPDRGRPGKRR